MAEQTIKNTTEKKLRAKRAAPITDPDCVYSWRTIPVSLAMVEKIAEELLEWPAKNPQAKTITEFYLSKGLKKETYNRLVNRHEVLRDAHEITMLRLGERLWGKAVDNQASWKPIHFMLHSYAPEFREADKYHASLKEANNEPSKIIIVEVPELIDRRLDEKLK